MRNTDWYNKEIDDVLNFYYNELSDEEMLTHLNYWIDYFPQMDFDWSGMLLDIPSVEKIPIESIIGFSNRLKEVRPDYYANNYEFVEYLIFEYAFFNKNIELIKERLAILKQNPVDGIDTVVHEVFYQLIYNRYFDLAYDFANAVWKPLSESEELLGLPQLPFVYAIFFHALENQFLLLNNGDDSSWDKLVELIQELGFEFNREFMAEVYKALTNELQSQDIEILMSKLDHILLIRIHFLKYMKEKYGISFMLSYQWFELVVSKDFFKKGKFNFAMPYNKLDVFVTSMYDNMFSKNQTELFGKILGLSYVYEFFVEYGFISSDAYKLMQENIAYLKHEFVKAFCSDLWKVNFVFDWPQCNDKFHNLYNLELFDSTKGHNYAESTEIVNSLKVNLPAMERINNEIGAKKTKAKNTTISNTFGSFEDNKDILDGFDYTEDGATNEYIETDYSTYTPYVNPGRKIGRNEPCPCGSGKKYKKCCLNK